MPKTFWRLVLCSNTIEFFFIIIIRSLILTVYVIKTKENVEKKIVWPYTLLSLTVNSRDTFQTDRIPVKETSLGMRSSGYTCL